jgi:peptide/nickel transport system substrate-binding protein
MNATNSISYDKNLVKRTYDVAKAKQLLTDAGYPSGFKTTITVRNTDNLDVVVAIQSYLGKVGIQCSIQPVTAAMFSQYANQGQKWTGLLLEQWNQNPDPTQGWNGGYGVQSLGHAALAKPAGWGDALTPAMQAVPMNPALCQKVMDLIYDNVTVIPLYEVTSQWALTPSVQDTGLGTGNGTNYIASGNIWLKK